MAALGHEPGWQADGEFVRQGQAGQAERAFGRLVGETARQCRKHVAGAFELLLQVGQGLLELRQRALGQRHVGAGGIPERELLLQDVQGPGGAGDDGARSLDLLDQRRLLDRRGDHIGGQGQIGGFELEALGFFGGPQRFDLPPVAAENVRGIADGELRRVERERRLARVLLARGREPRLHPGQVIAALGLDIGVGLAQRGLRRRHRGMGLKGLVDQRVQLGRPEQHPPPVRDVHALQELLGFSFLDRRGRRGGGKSGARERGAGRRLRLAEIRSDCAARERRGGQEERPRALAPGSPEAS